MLDDLSGPCQGPHCLCVVDLAIAREDLARSVEAINAARLQFERVHGKLEAAREVADAAAAFRKADKDRMAHLGGCVMPDPTAAYIVARDEFRRTADAWLAWRED